MVQEIEVADVRATVKTEAASAIACSLQVRSTGSVNPLTRQPIKGRKFGGGIRFGEMERDSLLAHGAAYLVHDRLHNCSDYHVIDVCSRCGSLLSTVQAKQGRATLHLSAVEADGEPRLWKES